MNKISLLSINIVNGNSILNKDGLPILLYWNKDDDLKNCLLDDSFKSLVMSLCKNDMYTNTKIKCVSFIECLKMFMYKSCKIYITIRYAIISLSTIENKS